MTTSAIRPNEAATWAEFNQPYRYAGPAGEIEVEQRSQRPPIDKLQHGFRGGEALPASWLNFLFRRLARWTRYLGDQIRIGDGLGAQIVDRDDVAIDLFAIDTTNPASFIKAVGYRGVGGAAALATTDNATLTLGAPLSDGSIPINGAPAANIRLIVRMYGAT